MPSNQHGTELKDIFMSHIHLDQFFSKVDRVIGLVAQKAKERATYSMDIFRVQFKELFDEMTTQYHRITCSLANKDHEVRKMMKGYSLAFRRDQQAGLCVRQRSSSSPFRRFAPMMEEYVRKDTSKFYQQLINYANDMRIFKKPISSRHFEDMNKSNTPCSS
eukprot:Nk52_evm3s237 gene=Nk52_evmTU3s237